MNRNKAFIFVMSNQFIHKITENIYDLALPLVILYYTQSSILMGVCYALGFVAEFLVGYFGGALVDSFNRRKTLIIIAISQAALISLIPILHSLDLLYIPLLLFIAFCVDFLLALYGITDISIIPEIVEKKDLTKANSYMQMSMSVAISIGPSLAGVLLTVIGLFNSLWITFAGFILLIFSLRLISYKNNIVSDAKVTDIFRKSFEGLKYTWSNQLYRSILIWNLFINLGLTGAVLMIIFRLKEELLLSPFQIGIIYTFSALGGIMAGGMLPQINKKFRSGSTLLCSSMLTGIALLGLFAFSNWIIVGVLNAILMGSVALNSRLIAVLYQSNVPIDYLGRVLSASRLISTILAPASVLAAGFLSDHYGAPTVFLIGSIIIIATNILAVRSPIRYGDWGKDHTDKEKNKKEEEQFA